MNDQYNDKSRATDPATREHQEQNPQTVDHGYGLPRNPSDQTAKRNEATDLKHREENEFIQDRNAPTDRQADKDKSKVADKTALNEPTQDVNEVSRSTPNPKVK